MSFSERRGTAGRLVACIRWRSRVHGALAVSALVVVALLGATGVATASAAPVGGLLGANLTAMAAPLAETSAGVDAWGQNYVGELGNGNTTSSKVPVAASGLKGATAVAGGGAFSLALLSNGTVMAWGSNGCGQLGNGTTTSSDVPIAVSGLSGVTAIAAGEEHALALLSNGKVMAWGRNDEGQLGDGTSTGPETCGGGSIPASTKPVAVSGLSGVTAIAAGERHNLALLSKGTVVAWGDGEDGELGDGSTGKSDVPVAVSGLSGVSAIGAGGNSLAVLSNGSVMDWGYNGAGQLGTGSTTGPEKCGVEINCSTKPVQVSGLSGVSAVAGGGLQNLALLSSGGVMAWGNNSWGQLGNGTETNSDVPVAVSGLSSGVTAIAAGHYQSLALLSGGTVMSWGSDETWQLGNSAAKGKSAVPVEVSDLTGATAIAGGAEFSLAVAPPAPVVPTVTGVSPNNGPKAGGTTVTITGSHFTGATAVKFGMANATSFKVESETSITAVSPAGTGRVNVSVTTPEGTSPTVEADQFSYGLPSITGLEPKQGGAHGGESVKITGTNFSGVTVVSFGSTRAIGFAVNSETSITAVAPQGREGETVNVTLTTEAGTSATSSADEFTYTAGGVCEEEESVVHPVVTSVEPKTGPAAGGTSVTIKGEHFTIAEHCALSPAKRVMFGSKEASFKYVHEGPNHEGELVATAPAGTGTVDVTVETATTSATSPADQFTYESAPAPKVTGVEPGSGPQAGGTSVKISGENFSGASAVKFGTSSAASFTVNSATSITAVAPPYAGGSALVDVSVTTPSGTSPTGPTVIGDGFAYQPTVTAVSPKTGPASGGTSVRISGAAFTASFKGAPPTCWACSVKFGSVNATSYKVLSESEIEAVAPPGTGTVDITVETLAGTSSTGSADQFTYEPATIQAEFANWVVSGGLTLKKVDQPIMLPAGATFNGSAALNPQTLSGPLTGSVAIPAFNAVVKILGVPATIGLEFSEVGSVEGSLEQSKTLPGDLSLSVPTKENISFTTIGILGLQIAAKCQTTAPLSLPLLAELSPGELLSTGAHFTGTTTIPGVKCEGSLASLESSVLTSLFSGPSNPYSITIAPPA
jgi:alpha-tubulin suppressor-like RCC1 family protein